MNLINKILLESEDENLFKPRRIEDRKEVLNQEYLDFKFKLNNIWFVKTRSKNFKHIVTRYLARGDSKEEVRQKMEKYLNENINKYLNEPRKIVSIRPIILNEKNIQLMHSKFEYSKTTQEFVNHEMDILLFN